MSDEPSGADKPPPPWAVLWALIAGQEPSGADKPPPPLRCSFCGKDQYQVEKLIAGPAVYICAECIELCAEILAEERQGDDPSTVHRQVGSGDR